MLIEIVQHEANKIVREATLEEAKAFRFKFPVNLVDSEGNRTPFELDADGEVIEPNAEADVNDEVAQLRADPALAKLPEIFTPDGLTVDQVHSIVFPDVVDSSANVDTNATSEA